MLAFHNKGYDVVSTDASAKMVEMAKLLTPKEALAATMACDVMRVRAIRIRITKTIGSHDQLAFLNRQFRHNRRTRVREICPDADPGHCRDLVHPSERGAIRIRCSKMHGAIK